VNGLDANEIDRGRPSATIGVPVPLYLQWFQWIERSDFSTWLRESPSVLVFPNILFLHTLAMGFVAGTNAAVDFCLLGFAPGLRVGAMEKLLPLMWSAFWVMVVTGILLLIAYPTKAFTNPVWYIKFLFIGLALVETHTINTEILGGPTPDVQPVPRRWKRLASASLFFWAGAIVAGKLLAHTYSHLFADM
jgi:hypothetical protein